MKRKHSNETPSVSAEEMENLLSPEETGADAGAPALEEFKSRRKGPGLRLPLGLLLTLLIMGGLGYFLWQYMQVESHGGGTLIVNEICSANHESLLSETLGTRTGWSCTTAPRRP